MHEPTFSRASSRSTSKARTPPTRWPSAGTTPTASCSASAWRTTSASPSATGTASAGRAATRSAATLSAPLASHGRRHGRRASSRPTSPSSCSRMLGVPFFCFHDRDVAPEGGDAGEKRTATVRAIVDILRARRAETGIEAALGHGQPVLQPPLHGRRGDQPRSRRLRLCRGAGEGGDGRHPRTRRRKLRAVGRSRRLRDAAQHRHEARAGPDSAASSPWSSSTSTRSASRARS